MLPPSLQINKLSPEWQYLFDMAGVNRHMMEDKKTLQFILDTMQKIGGAPHNLEKIQEEAVAPGNIPLFSIYTVPCVKRVES